ncbi:MAG: rRNA maturation RNase YbeY [Candidatus Omnitrophota bacterium]
MKITVKNFQKEIPINPKRIKKAILKTLSSQGIKKSGEITVSFVNKKKITDLNFRFLKRRVPTDCLSFDLSDEKKDGRILADVVVSADAAISNAKIFLTTARHELLLYVIHGVLHILGYDDRTPGQRKRMMQKATHILSRV